MKYIYLFLLLFISSPSLYSQVQLLKDINTGLADSEADQFVMMGDILYFAANDGEHGREQDTL